MLDLFNRLGPTPRALAVGAVIVLAICGVAMLFVPDSEERKDARLKATYTAYYGAQAKEARDRESGMYCLGWDLESHSLDGAVEAYLKERGIKDLENFEVYELHNWSQSGSERRYITLRYSVTNSSGERLSKEAEMLVDVESCETTLVRVE